MYHPDPQEPIDNQEPTVKTSGIYARVSSDRHEQEDTVCSLGRTVRLSLGASGLGGSESREGEIAEPVRGEPQGLAPRHRCEATGTAVIAGVLTLHVVRSIGRPFIECTGTP